MKPNTNNFERRDQIIAGLLWYGTWFASAIIAVGVLLMNFGSGQIFHSLSLNGDAAVKAGVAVFIVLPVSRVALMLTIFLRERDYAYVAIAALVLAVIATGVLIEVKVSPPVLG